MTAAPTAPEPPEPAPADRVDAAVEQAEPPRNPPRHTLRRWIARGASILVLVLVVDYLVLPQLAGAEQSLGLLRDASPAWLVLAVALEAGSIAAYSVLTRLMLVVGRTPSYAWVLRADLVGLGVSHCLPGGSATGNALRYRLMREGGVAADNVAVGLTLEGVLAAAGLVAMLWTALVVSIPFYGLSPGYLAGAVLGALVLAAVGLALIGHGRREALAPRIARRAILVLPQRFQPRLLHALDQGADRLQTLLSSNRMLEAAAGWAFAKWFLDAASLWLFLAAFGHRTNPIGLLVAYASATLVGMVPLTPSGLGVIEALLIPAMVALGAPQATAVLGVISWRLFEFWAPIPLAGVAYLSLRLQQRFPGGAAS